MSGSKKQECKVTVNIQPGPASPAQNAAWCKFWQRVIVETRKEGANEFSENNGLGTGNQA
jgi:hypothetical protein